MLALGLFVLVQSSFAEEFSNLKVIRPIVYNNLPGFQRLPEKFTLFLFKDNISTVESPGSMITSLAVNNDKMINPGCYIACYRHDYGDYTLDQKNYVVGLVRVWGSYNLSTQVCVPHETRNKDISKIKQYTDECTNSFSTCSKEECWAGGDTGGWFKFEKIKFTRVKNGKVVHEK
jgi:hypothetical protein